MNFIQYISSWLFERNGEIGIRSIDAKITQYDQDNRIMVNVILEYLSNNQPEMYCTVNLVNTVHVHK